MAPGTHFTDDFFTPIQWEFHFAVIQFQLLRLQQIFAHDKAA